jgi:hypothetical protein
MRLAHYSSTLCHRLKQIDTMAMPSLVCDTCCLVACLLTTVITVLQYVVGLRLMRRAFASLWAHRACRAGRGRLLPGALQRMCTAGPPYASLTLSIELRGFSFTCLSALVAALLLAMRAIAADNSSDCS